MQRFIPNKTGKPPAAGNAVESADEDEYTIGFPNLSDDENYWIFPPEMILNSGHNRKGEELRVSPNDIILAPETRVNFFIGVDMDCSEEGIFEKTYDENRYDWVHHALEQDTENMTDLQEGKYSMIEQNDTDDQKWRVAFEDLNDFSDAQLEDIKANSYGGNWDTDANTYGGKGWKEIDESGYHQLKDFSKKPDFSDQVIEVSLTPCSGMCEPPA